MELRGLAERFDMATDDETEGWAVPAAPLKGGEPHAKPKPFGKKGYYPRSHELRRLESYKNIEGM